MFGTIDDQAIFEHVRHLDTPEARQAFLQEKCGHDPAVLHRVQALLRANEENPHFLEPPPIIGGSTTKELPPPILPGTMIGPYKLLQQIGEGGMGVVYMAEQVYPVQRKVALKIIKPGMDSKQVIARFEAERQALAVMDHVNIARVIDGGETVSGQLYFVMELVHGVPITRFCDDNHLTPRERLELFIPVCQAIQHAHQKGIMHRDIKPSNVLVTLYDGKPLPKVIDFGVAKAFDQKLTDRTVLTNFGMLVGTLEYMSPEQAEMSAQGIDTRSDIYSLGVLLYELLTGSTPLTRQRINEAANLEILRLIKEEEPPRPSIRLSSSGDALVSISAQRKMEPAKLSKLLKGELDWIVMKTLEKDRNRRYETANGLGRDIQRYLADESVEACSPSMGYRIQKFARKNRVALTTAAAFVILLVAGTAISIWQAYRAHKQLAQIEKGNEILGSIFKNLSHDEEEKEGKSLRALLGERLDAAVDQLQGDTIGDPVAVARLQQTLAYSLLSLGYADKAKALFTQSQATLTTHLGPEHSDTLECISGIALCYSDSGEYEKALPLFEQAYQLSKKHLGPDHQETLTSMNNLGGCYLSLKKLDLAMPLLKESYDRRLATLPSGHHDILQSMANLAEGYHHSGDIESALPLLESTYKLRLAKLGPDHYDTLSSKNNLASAYSEMGEHDQAETMLKQVLARFKIKLGPDHPRTLDTMSNLANCYRYTSKFKEALALRQEAFQLSKAKWGLDHVDTIESMNGLALAHKDVGDLKTALSLLQDATAAVEKKGYVHPNAGIILNNLGSCYEELNQFHPSEELRRKRLKNLKESTGTESNDYAAELALLGRLLLKQKKLTEAETILRQSVAILQKNAPENWRTYYSTSLLGGVLLSLKNYHDAEPLIISGYQGLDQCEKKIKRTTSLQDKPYTMCLEEAQERLVQFYEETNQPKLAQEWREKFLVEEGAVTKAVDDFLRQDQLAGGTLELNASEMKAALARASSRLPGKFHNQPIIEAAIRQRLGELCRSVSDYQSAESNFNRALELRTKVLREEHRDTLDSMNDLGNVYRIQGKLDKAETLFLKYLSICRRALNEEHPDTVAGMNNLASVYSDQGRFDKAEEFFKKALKGMRRGGVENSDTISTASNLAFVYAQQKKYAEAEKLFEETLAIAKSVLGEENRDTLIIMNNLGAMYKDQKKYEKTEPLFAKTLAIRRRLLGNHDLETLTSVNNLGSLYLDQRNYGLAEPLFLEALEGIRGIHGFNHKSTLMTINNLVQLYEAQGNHAKAEPYYLEGLNEMRKRAGKKSTEAAGALALLSLNLLRQEKYSEAESLLHECLEIRELKEPTDWKTFNTRSMLGASLLGQKKYGEAEKLLLAGYEGMISREDNIPDAARDRLTEAVDRLVQLYKAMNRPDKVLYWEAKLPKAKPPEKR